MSSPTDCVAEPDPSTTVLPDPRWDRRGVVLIVDSQEQSLRELAGVLCREYDVRSTHDIGTAAVTAAALEPDLIVLAEHGLLDRICEVCAVIGTQPNTADTPIVVIGNHPHAEVRSLDAGAADFVSRSQLESPALLLRVRRQIGLKRERNRLVYLAGTDPLTGLANRRRFDELLRREFWRLRRADEPLSLVMLDIDRFKAFNDSYGHLAGDRCLTRVATAIAEVLHRAPDVAARFGGEEFCGILPETGAEGARSVARRIQERVDALHIEHLRSGVSPYVSVSIGLVSVNCSEIEGPSDVVEAADQNLYAAKNAGRDCIAATVVSTPPLPIDILRPVRGTVGNGQWYAARSLVMNAALPPVLP